MEVDKIFGEPYETKEEAEVEMHNMKNENPEYTYNISTIDVQVQQK